MLIINIFKWGTFVALVITNTAQTFLYFRIKKHFNNLPIIAAEIIHSELLNYNNVNGRRVYEADIKYKYRFRGKDL